MREIAEIVKWIDDEIKGCEMYAQAAIKAKENGEMEAGRTYFEIAKQECEHAERLHGIAVAKIREVEQSGRQVPQGMRDVWEWRHGEYVAALAEAKVMLQMYQ